MINHFTSLVTFRANSIEIQIPRGLFRKPSKVSFAATPYQFINDSDLKVHILSYFRIGQTIKVTGHTHFEPEFHAQWDRALKSRSLKSMQETPRPPMVRIIGIGALVLIVLCNSLASHAIAKQKGLVQKRSSQPALELAQMILMLPVQLEFLAIHPHFIDCKGVVNEEDRAQLTQKMEALSKQIHHPMVLTIKTISDTEKSFEWQGSWK